jgi:endonuclease/exonuclease/phosphatase (EEP) superfamily protein YafD
MGGGKMNGSPPPGQHRNPAFDLFHGLLFQVSILGTMTTPTTHFLKRIVIAFGHVYFAFLLGWLGLYLLTGDQLSILGLVNNFAPFLFIPIPIILLFALLTRRLDLIIASSIGILVFLNFWGPIFIPTWQPSPKEDTRPKLTVMTYNVLGSHGQSDPVLEVIRSEDADIVFLQELTPDLAIQIQTHLMEQYPYQVLDPQPGVRGMGTLSRYPVEDTGETLPLHWVGTPQILELDFGGMLLPLVNFHTYAYAITSLEMVDQRFREREAQAVELADFAARLDTPLIIAGDANAGDLSQTYRIITRGDLIDVWREAGFGLGGTFPGSAGPTSSRWKLGPWYVPMWIVRIDYIFVSSHWQVTSARVAPFDGVSDHRGVIATLILVK